MSATLPPVLDAWRMVSARRSFEGRLPLSGMPRLAGALAEVEGDCRYEVEFGRDTLGIAFVELRVQAELPLLCQRTLEPFRFPLRLVQRLGLVTDESQEAALPEGMEPIQPGPGGELHPAELIEDELILAIPVVPINPASTPVQADWPTEPADDEPKPNPFAALAALKATKK